MRARTSFNKIVEIKAYDLSGFSFSIVFRFKRKFSSLILAAKAFNGINAL